jgi:hypothetical protein
MSNLGLGTSSGYVMGYESGLGIGGALFTVSGTDSSFASGQVGLLVADESSSGTGTPGATFGEFAVVPEPGCGALLLLAGVTLWAARSGRKH